MCIRCRDESYAMLDLCPVCAVHTRLEVAAGFRRLASYLAAWAAFDRWLVEHRRA